MKRDGRSYVVAQVDEREVLAVVAKHEAGCGGLIAILEEIQAIYGYLPEQALRQVAQATDRSLVDIYGVSTFYRSFSMQPRGKHRVCVCLGTACHVRGAQSVTEEFEQRLGIQSGETSEDGEFSLETVNCLGACALGPVTVVDGKYVSKVKTSQVRGLLDKARKGYAQSGNGEDKEAFAIAVSCPVCSHSLMDAGFPLDDHPSIHVKVSIDHQEGCLRLSSLYGSGSLASECEIPPGEVAIFRCPHCLAELTGADDCSICQAPMAPMAIVGGGTMHVCLRRGCPGHLLDLQ
ncbi:MAG TPA: NAD(P)H-dependent oxidoreductase subunit E [Candidatus Hydrogenedentes bacterium]|nr:NAD(P)H-dependent oxidoreductase subunit E [Candidatus Hydrogenedentota bacterium]